jgi:hypothetical protein
MMNTVLVWILVSIGGYNTNTITYSPPMADLESCQRMQKSINDLYPGGQPRARVQCIQVKVLK